MRAPPKPITSESALLCYASAGSGRANSSLAEVDRLIGEVEKTIVVGGDDHGTAASDDVTQK